MSVRTRVRTRRRRLAGAVALVAAAATATLAFVPGIAEAATGTTVATGVFAAPASPLTVTASAAQPGPLLPGGAAKTFTLAVRNTTGHAVPFTGALGGGAHGALPVSSEDVRFGLTALHAPATASFFGSQDDGLLGYFYPKGSRMGSRFTIPAHATWTWKVTVGAAKTFPLNDDRIAINFDAVTGDGTTVAYRAVSFKVGTEPSGGPVVTSLTGPNTIAPGKPAVLTYTATNRTGLPLAEPLYPWIGQASDVRDSLDGVRLAFDLWQDGHWVTLGTGQGGLPTIPAHLAEGATVKDLIRVRVVGWTSQAHSGLVQVAAEYDGWMGTAWKNFAAHK